MYIPKKTKLTIKKIETLLYSVDVEAYFDLDNKEWEQLRKLIRMYSIPTREQTIKKTRKKSDQ